MIIEWAFLFAYLAAIYYSWVMAVARGRNPFIWPAASLFIPGGIIPLLLWVLGDTDKKTMEILLETIDNNTE